MRRIQTLAWVLGLVGLLGSGTARAEAPPQPQVIHETASVQLRDSGGANVELRVPHALHRPANRFRLYGWRPLTLHGRNRRRDLFRDAFLELATQSRLHPRTSAWDSLGKQLQWLGMGVGRPSEAGGSAPDLPLPPLLDLPADALRALEQRVEGTPAESHVGAITRALRDGVSNFAKGQAQRLAAEPMAMTLQLRALATDDAERRLQALGTLLRLEAPGTDPAMRDGYRLAQREFDELRRGLWPALAQAMRKNQGRLVLSAVKEIVFSRLGFWAMFGQMGWQAVEGIVNTEYHGQYAVCLATVAHRLAENAGANSEARTHALYAEFALNYELNEAFSHGQLMAWKPAGGRSSMGWRLHFSERGDLLKRAIAPAPDETAQAR